MISRVTRREFVASCAAGGLLYAAGRPLGPALASGVGAGGFADYKALVCVFLLGGNDSWNMLVPRSGAEYDTYARSRENLAVPRDQLLPVGADGAFGLHPAMGDVASLMSSNRCAALVNVGPLIAPTSKDEYLAQAVPLPPQLFSHHDQVSQCQTLRGRADLKTGWAGRVAEVIAEQTSTQPLAMNVSLSGSNSFQVGARAMPYVMSAAGAVTFWAQASTGGGPIRKAAFDGMLQADYGTIYERAYVAVQKRAVGYGELVNGALATAPTLTTTFPTSSTAAQLQTVARMIAVREHLGMTRQIFFVLMDGFDTHDDHLARHPKLLADLGSSLAAFHEATVELGVAANVTTFTQSEFGRRLASNGDGTDHGWAGVHLIVGDAVDGGKIYGDYPVLEIGGSQDVGGGRVIPTISTDQYAATLARWFGVEESSLTAIAPSLPNFPVKDLGFML